MTLQQIKTNLTGNCIGSCTEMAKESKHLRRHTWDQPYRASGDDGDDDDGEDEDADDADDDSLTETLQQSQ